MFKQWMLVVAVMVCGFAGGCLDQDFTPEQFQQFATQVSELSAKVDDYQSAIADVMGTLEAHKLISAETAEEVAKVSSEINRVQPQVADVITAIMATNLGDDDVANWIALLQAANQGSTPWNPYALPITAGLTLASIIYGLLKRKEAEKNGLKYQAHKAGTELTMKTAEPELQKEMYANIGEARRASGIA